MNDQSRLCFGNFTLNRSSGRLEDQAGRERFLRPKSFRVLELLCERRRELLSKDELVREAWPNVVVSDDSLVQCISDIRRALGPEGRRLLRTIPRRGYMLDDPEPEIAPGGPKNAYSSWLRVITLASFTGIAAAGWLWGIPLTPRTDEESVIGAQAVLQQADMLLDQRDWRRRENNEAARRLLESALVVNPDNSELLASLALTFWMEVQHLRWGGGKREMDRAMMLVHRSIVAGGGDRSHRLLAEMRLLAPFAEFRSPVDGLASARAALTINPDSSDNMMVLAQALALTGQTDDAVGWAAQALARNPNPPAWHRQIAGLCYLLAGKPVAAAEQLGSTYGAGTFASGRWWPGWLFVASLAHAGRIDEATGVVKAASHRRPERNIAAVAQSLVGLTDESGLALILDGLRLAGMPG